MDGDGARVNGFSSASAGENTVKKRIRKSRSRGLRTKNGCLTCRKRHKKCDETLPTCGACSISNRECVYGIEEDSSQTSKIKASPRTSVSSETPTNVSTSIVSKAESQVPSAAGPSSLSSYSSAAEASQPQTFVSRSEAYPRLCSRYSPDTIVSEQLLTADRASTKWLDLLATDAAQADSSFFLAPSPVPEDSVSNVGCEERRHSGVDSQTGPVARPLAKPAAERVFEKHAWQLDKDIVLQNREATLFRMFTERVALWLDLFDPSKHFSTYAVRLALRNLGLMKAILALTARHSAIVQANSGANSEADFHEAVQYYYETLHYVQMALHHHSYTRSEELLATALIISTYEMLDASSGNWKRHLKGVFWIQRSQNVNGASGGLRQSVWWAWLRQDIWAAFREKRGCFSFWRPVQDYPELNQDQVADRAIYLLSQTVNYCANLEDPLMPELEASARRTVAGNDLMAKLERWKTFCGPKFEPLPTADTTRSSVFRPLWIHPGRYGVALQVHSFSRILVTLHRPPVSGFDDYLETQRTLSEAVATICGIAMELKDEGCQIISAYCLFGAGLCVQDEVKRNAIISLIDECEKRTGWPMEPLRHDLRAEWANTGR